MWNIQTCNCYTQVYLWSYQVFCRSFKTFMSEKGLVIFKIKRSPGMYHLFWYFIHSNTVLLAWNLFFHLWPLCLNSSEVKIKLFFPLTFLYLSFLSSVRDWGVVFVSQAASVSCLLRYVMFEMRYLIKSIHLHRVEQDTSRWRHANSFIPLRWCDTEADSCRCRSDCYPIKIDQDRK